MASILLVNMNPPTILMAVKKTANNPNHEVIETTPSLKEQTEIAAASIATTITTLEIAFVIDIKGAWRAGVTFDTT